MKSVYFSCFYALRSEVTWGHLETGKVIWWSPAIQRVYENVSPIKVPNTRSLVSLSSKEYDAMITNKAFPTLIKSILTWCKKIYGSLEWTWNIELHRLCGEHRPQVIGSWARAWFGAREQELESQSSRGKARKPELESQSKEGRARELELES